MGRSVTQPWLLMCAAVYAAALACSNNAPPDLPPVEATGTAAPLCEVSDRCTGAGSYCIAVAGQGCKYLECVNDSWRCPPEGGLMAEGGAMPDTGASADAAESGSTQDAQSQ